ncbi:Transcriptional activator spt7 [Allomyces javanicus]|nr:Transcriptional activator spt7 [Allomyces javanicus]
MSSDRPWTILDDKAIEVFPYFDDDPPKEPDSDHDTLEPLTIPNGPSCKYLLAALAKHRGLDYVQSEPILSLLRSDTKKGHSKWASNEWIGQEELYEACDRVLTTLRSNSDFKAFVNRVSVRDVPDYYTIIKNPMDFTRMRNKMLQFEYKSKNDFLKDLDLIYTNCMTYNSHPESVYRTFGTLLKEQTEVLAMTIPDVVVRRYTDPPPPPTVAEQQPAAKPALDSPGAQFALQPAVRWDPKTPVPTIPLAGTPAFTDEEAAILANVYPDFFPPHPPAEPAPASPIPDGDDALPHSTAPNRPTSAASETGLSDADPDDIAPRPVSRTHAAVRASMRTWKKLRDVADRITEIKEDGIIRVGRAAPEAETPAAPGPATDALRTGRSPSPARRAQFLGDAAPLDPPHPATAAAPAHDADTPDDPPVVRTEWQAHAHVERAMVLLLGHLGIDAAHATTLQVIVDLYVVCLGKLGETLRVLADQWPDHVDPASDAPRRELDGETVLLKALRLNGLDPVAVQDHVTVDICKASHRLGDLNRRLENKYKDLVTGGNSGLGLDDLPMEGLEDAFAGGNFLTGLLGEDFFGFRGMGLPGTVPTAVPATLWYRDDVGYYRRAVQAMHGAGGANSVGAAGALEFPDPPPFPPLVRRWLPKVRVPTPAEDPADEDRVLATCTPDGKPVIALMQPWLANKWAAHDAAAGTQPPPMPEVAGMVEEDMQGVVALPEDEEVVSARELKSRLAEREARAGIDAPRKAKKPRR